MSDQNSQQPPKTISARLVALQEQMAKINAAKAVPAAPAKVTTPQPPPDKAALAKRTLLSRVTKEGNFSKDTFAADSLEPPEPFERPVKKPK